MNSAGMTQFSAWPSRAIRASIMVLIVFFALLISLARASEPANPHWSLQPLKPAKIPNLQDPWVANPIDAFILERLTRENLRPSPPADQTTLLRRMFLVVHGLPPSPEEIDRFQNAPLDVVIDHLLGSPRYGERWAQHWLDTIRWAETVGFETNSPRPNAWPYRDWLIASLNADTPYDQFVFEQIAGDTVHEDAALGFLVAGPANLPGQIGRDEESMRQARQDELDEVLRTVTQAFLGLTVACARCHDHKFDPITARDYYSMQAIFAGLQYGDRRWRGPENDRWTAQAAELALEVRQLENDLETLRKQLNLHPPISDVQEERFAAVQARSVRMEISATASGTHPSLYEFEIWSAPDPNCPPVNVALSKNGARATASSFALENQTRHPDNLIDGSTDARQAFPWKAGQAGPAWIQIDLPKTVPIDRIVWHRGESVPIDYEIRAQSADGPWMRVVHSRTRLPRADDRRKTAEVQLTGLSAEQTGRVVDLIGKLRAAQAEQARLSAGPPVFGAVFSAPEPTWLLNRGDPMQRIQQVGPAVPVVLGRLDLAADCAEADRRLALARHLTRPDHPLTARVLVNRVWQYYFGEGLVDTPSDFGKMGTAPTHPDLLDWLAIQFVEQGWSLKKLHRQILQSSTFRQASRPHPEALAKDAASRLLWRFPPRRLEAEAIRDSILAVSGKLNLTMGGPGFDFFNQKGGLSDYKSVQSFKPDGWRRMIYATKIRMHPVDIFGVFDCPDAGQMTPKRPRSITPIQSLSLWNSTFIQDQAAFFAERLRAEAGPDVRHQMAHAIRLAFSRTGQPVELDTLESLAKSHGLEQVCRVLFNANEFMQIP